MQRQIREIFGNREPTIDARARNRGQAKHGSGEEEENIEGGKYLGSNETMHTHTHTRTHLARGRPSPAS